MAEIVVEASGGGHLYSGVEYFETYAEAHDIAIGVADEGGLIVGQQGPADEFAVHRGGLVFNLAGQKAVTPTGCTISLFEDSGEPPDTHFDIVIVSGADLGDTMEGADFGKLLDEITSLGSLSTEDWVPFDWNTITLNATGIAAVKAALAAGGKIRFGVRSSKDIDSISPTSQDTVWTRGYADEGLEPKLTITYSTVKGNPNIDQLIYQHVERMER
ncbi:hypothetical protein KKH23_09500 [Patescibacteria group bacterium]|nr:hypothetical protein [Patescibacteria group bacterium]